LEWYVNHNNKVLPSLFQIKRGLIREAMVQLTEAMMNVAQNKAIVEAKNDITNQWKQLFDKAHEAAKQNITETWNILLEKAQVPDENEPLTAEILRDPTHPVVVLLNYCYTMDGFTFRVLNQSSRVKDFSKVPTMGPYSAALSQIIAFAQQHRTDITLSEFSKCWLFRGTGLTVPEIEEFRVLAKTRGLMRMFGYTSTSRKQEQAEKFATSNTESQTKKVVFHIRWEDAKGHFFMNKGAFS